MSYLIKSNRTLNLSKIHHQIRKFSSQSLEIPEAKKHLVPVKGTYPKGFKATGIHCGIKKNGRKDLSLIISERPCTSSAVFTTNIFKAAPVLLSREILDKHNGQNIYSLVTNSGCANAVTGTKGLANARIMSDAVSKLNGVEESSLVMSTGVIGQHIPIEKIVNGINQAYELAKQQITSDEELHEGWIKSAESFMTTDTFPKLRSKQFTLPSGLTYSMAGISKGAGMIHPNMATLLATVVTDVPISAKALNEALKHAADRSFNAISIDNDMSTNDTFAILANGAATKDAEKLKIDDLNGRDFIRFRDDLTEFAADLAKLVVRDGEGATKFVTIHVKGAKSFADAKQIASTISTSSLVKTALYGQDANWGRILCAVGYAGVSSIIPGKVSVSFVPTDGTAPLRLLTLGEPENVDEARASEILAMEELEISVDLDIGNQEAKMWTCDYSHEYISINADYRT